MGVRRTLGYSAYHLKRPLFICLIFCVLGAALRLLNGNLLLPYVVFTCFGMICVYLHKKFSIKIYYIFCAFFLMGVISVEYGSFQEAKAAAYVTKDAQAFIKGTVEDYEYTSTGKQKLTVRTSHIIYGGEAVPAKLKIHAIIEEGQFAETGDRVLLQGSLEELESARNPGAYNEKYFMGARQYDFKTYAALLENEPHSNINSLLGSIRSAFSSTYDRVLPEREAGIIKAMVLGDRAGLEQDVKEMYRDAGIYHVLVVSGLHLSITALVLQYILSVFLSVRKSSVITIVLLIFYVLLTGSSVSTVRAAFAAVTVILGKLLYKNTDAVTSASFAGIILILYEPLYLLDVGFQFSFSAVFGIGFFAEPISKNITAVTKGLGAKNQKLLGYVQSAFAVSLAVFIATVPVQVYHFNTILPWSVFINIIISPVLTWVLICGFAIGFTGVFSIYVSSLLSGALYFLLKFYESICLFFEKLPYSKILMATPHYAVALCYYALIILILYICTSKLKTNKKLVCSTVTVAVYIGVYMICILYPKPPSLTMLDVGQGDCTVIENQGETFIIDGGGWYGRELGSNTGAVVLSPYLDYKGIEVVNGAFISHLNSDHATGIIELVRLKTVEKVYLPVISDKTDSIYLKLAEVCDEFGTEIIFMKQGDVIRSPKGVVIMALSPDEGTNGNDQNEMSLVLYVNMGISAIFTGDIGKSTEKDIVQRYNKLEADILKVSHHGSKYSSSDELLDAVKPSYAIAGVGENNNYGHPSPEVVSRLSDKHIKFYSTNKTGAVIIRKHDRTIEIKTMLDTGD